MYNEGKVALDLCFSSKYLLLGKWVRCLFCEEVLFVVICGAYMQSALHRIYITGMRLFLCSKMMKAGIFGNVTACHGG